MNSSTFKWLSGAIGLPLFLTTLNSSTPVGAEQMNRAKQLDRADNSAVINSNLTIPPKGKLAIDRERSATAKTSPRNSSRVITVSVNRDSAARSRDNLTRQRVNPQILPAISLANEPAPQIKSDRPKNIGVAAVNPTLAVAKDTRRPKTNFKHKPGKLARGEMTGNYLRLVKDPNRSTNSMGNPIYTLETYIDRELDRRFKVVSGTARTQQADRNIGDNYAPLPDGMYEVSNWITLSDIPEVDRTFISITPKFQTSRTELGIHRDPSFNKPNGYDGTAGCIGMTTDEDRDAINNFVTKYRPNKLLVKILPNEKRE
jgi:hypothetical protein